MLFSKLPIQTITTVEEDMKPIYLSVLLIFLTGCASNQNLHTVAPTGNSWAVVQQLDNGANVDQLGYWGTPLGSAARFNNVDTAKTLLSRGADVNGGNPGGAISKTPLHAAASEGHVEVALILLEHGANPNIRNRDNRTPAELALHAGHVRFSSIVQEYGASADAWSRCQSLDTLVCYQGFTQRYPNSAKSQEAQNIISDKQHLAQKMAAEKELAELKAKIEEEKRLAKLKESQACELKDQNWFYLGTNCEAGFAEGKGTAIHKDGELKFSGMFASGMRTNGEIQHNNVPLFDGPIVDGKPNGIGVCFLKGQPEECKYYKGERIDTLHKQRIELASQRKYMELMKQEMSEMKEMNAKPNVVVQQAPVQQTGYQSPTVGDHVKDAVMKKAASTVTDMIFDSLF